LIAKSDLKEMTFQAVPEVSAKNPILSLNITAGGRSEGLALASVISATNFLKKGGSYLSIKLWLSSLQSEMQSADIGVAKNQVRSKPSIKSHQHPKWPSSSAKKACWKRL